MNDEAKHEDIRKAILHKSQELGWKHGIKRITMDILAKECGVSKKTIYIHFKNKNDLVMQSTEEIIQNLKEQTKMICDEIKDPVAKIKKLLEVPFEMFRHVPTVLLYDIRRYYPQVEERINTFRMEHKDVLLATFKEGISKGVFRDLNPNFVAEFFQGAGNYILNTEFMLKNDLSVEETFDNYRTMLLSGLLKNAG